MIMTCVSVDFLESTCSSPFILLISMSKLVLIFFSCDAMPQRCYSSYNFHCWRRSEARCWRWWLRKQRRLLELPVTFFAYIILFSNSVSVSVSLTNTGNLPEFLAGRCYITRPWWHDPIPRRNPSNSGSRTVVIAESNNTVRPTSGKARYLNTQCRANYAKNFVVGALACQPM